MQEELDMSYKAKSARVFGRIWGTMRDMDMGNKIVNAKSIIRPELDRQFKDSDEDFESASACFSDSVLDYLEAVGASEIQLKVMEMALDDALTFNFGDAEGNQ